MAFEQALQETLQELPPKMPLIRGIIDSLSLLDMLASFAQASPEFPPVCRADTCTTAGQLFFCGMLELTRRRLSQCGRHRPP